MESERNFTDSPTPEMIAAGADALENVNDIGRWLAESLAASVLERAFEAHRQRSSGGGDAVMAMSPKEAAWTIQHKTGAVVTPCTLHERAGDVARWVVQSPFAHQPQICTDAEIITWASELDGLPGPLGSVQSGLPAGAHTFQGQGVHTFQGVHASLAR